VEEIKKIRPEMKVLMMSASKMDESEFGQIMESTKVDGFIQKPFDMENLISKVRSLCS
jgi:DNA-binding NtrC family response regulator